MSNSATYYPSIIYKCGVYQHELSTTNPWLSMKAAKNQIADWAEDFHIMHAWVDVYTKDEFDIEHRRRISLF